MRAVLDVNVVIAAALSPAGTTSSVLRAWLDGSYELVVSPLLLDELERALAYPKIRARVTAAEADELVDLLRLSADVEDDPAGPPPIRSADPGDDYLVALAEAAGAVIVSGDRHLLDLGDRLPVYTPAEFLALLDAHEG
ncbi:MAG: putative toxin-antitoxin system toxin component, PIN family [Acidimicrobiales bacterium]